MIEQSFKISDVDNGFKVVNGFIIGLLTIHKVGSFWAISHRETGHSLAHVHGTFEDLGSAVSCCEVLNANFDWTKTPAQLAPIQYKVRDICVSLGGVFREAGPYCLDMAAND